MNARAVRPARRESVAALSVLRWGEPAQAALTLLLIHPTNLQASCWQPLVDALPDWLACVAPDLRGHGCSPRQGPFSVAGWAQDCSNVLAAHAARRVCLLGASAGAAIAFEVAAAQPASVASIVGLGGALLPANPDGDPMLAELTRGELSSAARRRIVDDAVAPATDETTREAILAQISDNDADVAAAIWRAALATDVRAAARRWHGPCLLATGVHDTSCPASEVQPIARELGCEFRLLPDVGHLAFLEDPSGVAARLREWIGEDR
jgi:pimeloyl-ACP methyl ester carboxylesterase